MHIAALEIGWLVECIAANLLWVFMFFALGYLLFGSGNAVRAFFHVSLVSLLFYSLIPFAGWAGFTGDFLLLYYLFYLAVMGFAENSVLSRHMVLIGEFAFFGILIFYNLFMGGH